jgi:ABC-type glycerol-3-phosphate transport system substrate-binding protein
MTGLERLVQNNSGSHQTLSRYLTLFYCFTLGLGLVLALLAIGLQGNETPSTATTPQAVLSQTATPNPESTQVHSSNTPTSLPDIPSTPNEKTPSALGVTANELRGLEVSLWYPWTGEKGAALQAILDEFNRTNKWKITVQTSAFEDFGRLDEAVESALLLNTQPDLIVDYGYQANHWDSTEAILDLTPYVNDPVWGLTSDEQADFYPTFWAEDLVMDGSSSQTRRLGIPYYRSAYVLYYNQSWAHELGYPDPPTTLEDFRVRACAAAQYINKHGDKSNLGKGGWLITPQPGVLVGWIYAFGGWISNLEAPGYQFNTLETKHALEYLKGLQNSGCAWSETAVDAQSEFANRHALFVVGSLFDIPAQQEAFTKAGSADKWMTIPFPSDSQPVVDSYGPSLLITRSTPAKQLAAWLVTKWLVYPPNQAEWVKTLETYPSRRSALDYLTEAASENPQWSQALELLPNARSEPSLASWKMMRWALEDVMKQLFNPQFSADQIPSLLEKLDSVAAEIFLQVR